jgi:hypothetical protein
MRRPLARGIDGGGDVGALAVDRADPCPLRRVAHHEEAPVLRVAGRGGADRRIQQPGDQRLRHRVGAEAAQRAGRIHGLEESDLGHGGSVGPGHRRRAPRE